MALFWCKTFFFEIHMQYSYNTHPPLKYRCVLFHSVNCVSGLFIESLDTQNFNFSEVQRMFFFSSLCFPPSNLHRVFSQADVSSQNMVNTDQKGVMKQGAVRQGREASMNTQGIWGS